MIVYEKNVRFEVRFNSENEASLHYGLNIAVNPSNGDILRDENGDLYCHASEQGLISMMIQYGYESFSVVEVKDPEIKECKRITH